jgi:hypothetical protein
VIDYRAEPAALRCTFGRRCQAAITSGELNRIRSSGLHFGHPLELRRFGVVWAWTCPFVRHFQ